MLEKKFRLKKSKKISYILNKGKTFKTDIFTAKYYKSEVSFDRFTVITSQKFSRHAVQRNRARRRIYEALRLALQETERTKCVDCVIIPHKHIIELDFTKIKNAISSLLLKTQE
ncbi:ribonuclease P protein component [Candidatus Peregrinibacteria bacterium]|nr:ribonuclease P protein component [Candidatus Peregrinibacteria bacterium]